MIAVLLNALSVISFEVVEKGGERMFVMGVVNRGFNVAVIIITAGLLLIMFFYLVIENLPVQPCT